MYIYLKLNKIVIIIIIILKKRNFLYGSEQAVTLKFVHALKDLSDKRVFPGANNNCFNPIREQPMSPV